MLIDLVAFDADDTLWHNESLYTNGRQRFRALMQVHGFETPPEELLDEIEIQNIPYYGYGVNGFVFSLIETAIRVTDGTIPSGALLDLVQLSKDMLSAEVQLFDGVQETVARLSSQYPLMLITKGDLRHQQSKLQRSGLEEYFRFIEIVSSKDAGTYARILEDAGVSAERFVMIGNSLRSDILPVLELGGWAVHIPDPLTWSHEIVGLPDPAPERFFETAHITDLPSLLERLG
jgi:putative hydrolase of the HAD superfamily